MHKCITVWMHVQRNDTLVGSFTELAGIFGLHLAFLWVYFNGVGILETVVRAKSVCYEPGAWIVTLNDYGCEL